METGIDDTETLDLWPEADAERAFLDRLTAGGVRPATRGLDRPRKLVRERPRWIAFLLRRFGRKRA